MRTLAISAAALLMSAGVAFAAPSSVSVTVGPDLQKKAVRTYGVKEVDDLAQRLQQNVARRLADNSAYDGARVELVLADATPTKPTMKQLDDTPGLSYFHSRGAGGATIEGRIVRADGQVTPVHYRYYEDLRWSRLGGTWGDAEGVFDRFAGRLDRGDQVASR